jgi:hypothetical protein
LSGVLPLPPPPVPGFGLGHGLAYPPHDFASICGTETSDNAVAAANNKVQRFGHMENKTLNK